MRKRKEAKRKGIALTLMRDLQGSGAPRPSAGARCGSEVEAPEPSKSDRKKLQDDGREEDTDRVSDMSPKACGGRSAWAEIEVVDV
jgi:hypothetical protein